MFRENLLFMSLAFRALPDTIVRFISKQLTNEEITIQIEQTILRSDDSFEYKITQSFRNAVRKV